MSYSARCMSPESPLIAETERGGLVLRGTVMRAAAIARSLVNDTNPAFSKRPAIQTAHGPASVTAVRFGGPMETPTMLGVVYLPSSGTVVMESHGLGFPYDSFAEHPDTWCGMAGIAIDGSLEWPESGMVTVTPHLGFNLVEDAYFLKKDLDEAGQGAGGFGYEPELPVDPRANNDALLVVSAFRDNQHVFAHPALNEALLSLPDPVAA